LEYLLLAMYVKSHTVALTWQVVVSTPSYLHVNSVRYTHVVLKLVQYCKDGVVRQHKSLTLNWIRIWHNSKDHR